MTLQQKLIEQTLVTQSKTQLGGGWFQKDHCIAFPIKNPIEIWYTKHGKRIEGLVYEYRYNKETQKYYAGLVIEYNDQLITASCDINILKVSDGSQIQLPAMDFSTGMVEIMQPVVDDKQPTTQLPANATVPKVVKTEVKPTNQKFAGSLVSHPQFEEVNKFVELINDDKVKYKAYFNKFKAMTSGMTNWSTEMSNKKFENLLLMVNEFKLS